MAVSRVALKAFMLKYQALQRAAVEASGPRSGALNKSLQLMLDALMQEVMRGTNASGPLFANPAHAREFERRVNAIVGTATRGNERLYRRLFDAVTKDLETGLPRAYAELGRARQLTGVVESFRRRADEGLYRIGFRRWYAEMNKLGTDVRGIVVDATSKGALNGWSQRRTVEDLLGNPLFRAEGLPPIGEQAKRIYSGGTMDESLILKRRAYSIVRTEATAARNAGIELWAKEAGFDRYINANDAPVAKVCKAATAQPPMTLEEWGSSPWGRPPRHPQCDSDLIPVPDDLTPDTYRDVVIEEITDDPEGLLAAAAELAGN